MSVPRRERALAVDLGCDNESDEMMKMGPLFDDSLVPRK